MATDTKPEQDRPLRLITTPEPAAQHHPHPGCAEGCLLAFPHDPDDCWTEIDKLSGVPRMPPPDAPSHVVAAWRSYQLAAEASNLAAQAAREAGRPFHVCDDCGRCPWECEGGCCDCIPF